MDWCCAKRLGPGLVGGLSLPMRLLDDCGVEGLERSLVSVAPESKSGLVTLSNPGLVAGPAGPPSLAAERCAPLAMAK